MKNEEEKEVQIQDETPTEVGDDSEVLEFEFNEDGEED